MYVYTWRIIYYNHETFEIKKKKKRRREASIYFYISYVYEIINCLDIITKINALNKA